VTGRRESPLPRWAAASAASDTSRGEAPKPGHNCGKLGNWAKESRQPRRGQAHVAQVEVEEPALLLPHASIELSLAASIATALLHLDEPRAHVLFGDGSSSILTIFRTAAS
jgi:hypothetical protein